MEMRSAPNSITSVQLGIENLGKFWCLRHQDLRDPGAASYLHFLNLSSIPQERVEFSIIVLLKMLVINLGANGKPIRSI